MSTVDRITTLDNSYRTGDLSIYPVAKDSAETLYSVTNNGVTTLTQSLSYSSTVLMVGSTASFPSKGILVVGTELIYYSQTTINTFSGLKRGFAGSRQNVWPTGTQVTNSVTAEPHNAEKDALINIEHNLGLQAHPDAASLNGILKSLEARFLAPKPLFKAAPIKGPPPMTVKFQNFSTGTSCRYLWDFGDGGTSVETSPTHTYLAEGLYTIKLNMITSLGAQGVTTKSNYIEVSLSDQPAFFYVTPMIGVPGVTTFTFVDQTGGSVNSRYWIFDDGETTSELDGAVHVTAHKYATAGSYNPSLIVVFEDQSLKRLTLTEPIVVS